MIDFKDKWLLLWQQNWNIFQYMHLFLLTYLHFTKSALAVLYKHAHAVLSHSSI